MRPWYKYSLRGEKEIKFSNTLDYTTYQIRYDAKELNKRFNFNFFYQDFSKYLYDFLIKKLYGKNLSIGSGWGHLEYHLSKKINITASDINEEYSKYNKNIKYKIINIISNDFKIKAKYDNVFAPGIIYLFNNAELNKFFKNIKKTLNDDGNFYLFFRSRDSFFIYFLDNLLLPLENIFKYVIKKIKAKVKIQKNHHGYRRYNHELKKLILKNKFKIISSENFMYEAEYNRSKILRMFGINKILALLKMHPYITVYHLKKLL